MAQTARHSSSAPRLNPFAFRAATDLRFVLLIASVLGASLFVYNWLYTLFLSDREAYLEAAQPIEDRASAAFDELHGMQDLLTTQAGFESWPRAALAQLERERAGLGACAGHPDGMEGISAFTEKRKPDFNRQRKN